MLASTFIKTLPVKKTSPYPRAEGEVLIKTAYQRMRPSGVQAEGLKLNGDALSGVAPSY